MEYSLLMQIFTQKKYGWHKKVGTRKLKRMQCFFFPRLDFVFWRPKKTLMRMVERHFFGSKKVRKSPYFEKKEVTSCHILKKKKPKVAIFRQSISICRQNWVGIVFSNLLYY
jgi:hypothetical protein